MAIFMTARWRAKPESTPAVEAAIRDFVSVVRENEPGTRLYTGLKQTDTDATYMTYFIFEDESAHAYHRTTEWVKRFTETIYPKNVEQVEFTHYDLVASTDEMSQG